MAVPPNLPTNHVDNTIPVERLKATDINDLAAAINSYYVNGVKPAGAAGGDLAGSTYPNPVIAANAVTAAKLAAGAATGAALGSDVLVTGSSAQVKTGALTAPLIDKGGQAFNAKAYGAVGDGASDDTAKLQAALAAANVAPQGSVFLPAATYAIASSLDFTNTHNLRFSGGGGGSMGLTTSTFLRWTGAAGGTAIKMWDCRDNIIENFTLWPMAGPGGMAIGIDITKSGTPLVNSTHLRFNNVTVVYAGRGFQVGVGASGNTEFMIFDDCFLSACDYGYYFDNYQTKHNQFRGGQIVQSTIAGVYCNSGSFHMWAPQLSFNAIDIVINNAIDDVTIIAPVSESAGRFLDMYGGGRPVNVYGGRLSHDLVNADNNYIRTQSSGALNLHGVEMASGVSMANWRIFVQAQVAWPAMVTAIGCTFPNSTPWNVTPTRGYVQQQGCLYSDGTGHVVLLPDRYDRPQDFRSIPGLSGTNTKANNLRGSATFATANNVAVTFGTPEVQSLVATGASSGTFTLSLLGYTTTALNWNATASQVQTALRALANIGSVGVVCTGGPLPNTAITITFAGPLVGGGPQALITATSSLVGGTAVVTRTSAGTGNPPEPDATYFVSFGGNANETFWVTAKATMGFTFNSSNPTSTAVVDWHLTR